MAMDIEGNLMVAHVGAGIVWGFSALGVPIMRIDSCEGLATTNMAYGGKDNQTLFITESESGCVLIANLDVPGRPMHSHQ
jgi:gluconolactonase